MQVPAANVETLSGTIASLLDDPQRREQLGRAARRRIEDLFCWQVAAGQMTRYYREVLARADG